MCPRVLIILTFIRVVCCVKIDLIDCGVDHVNEVTVGDIEIEEYAWLGILYYTDEFMDGFRATTPVVLIHEAFCLASASDINDMPKEHFRANTRVLIGEDWTSPSRGRRVRNYVLHPEFGETLNTLAIIHLKDAVRNGVIRHVCPPPEILHDPDFFVVRFKNDYHNLQKEVIPMYYVPPRLCRDFYVAAKLYEEKMRPPHVVCACSIEHDDVCVWEAGSVLMTRDVWGRWQLLGFGVRGPGCSAPSRYLDMLSYYPWVHVSLHRFQQITISKIHNHKYVLRSTGAGATRQGAYITRPTGTTNKKQVHPDIKLMIERYGDCDPEERPFLLFREFIS